MYEKYYPNKNAICRVENVERPKIVHSESQQVNEYKYNITKPMQICLMKVF